MPELGIQLGDGRRIGARLRGQRRLDQTCGPGRACNGCLGRRRARGDIRRRGSLRLCGARCAHRSGGSVEFVERTGVDALAVAVGNVHGIGQRPVDLDFQRLEAIRRQAEVPSSYMAPPGRRAPSSSAPLHAACASSTSTRSCDAPTGRPPSPRPRIPAWRRPQTFWLPWWRWSRRSPEPRSAHSRGGGARSTSSFRPGRPTSPLPALAQARRRRRRTGAGTSPVALREAHVPGRDDEPVRGRGASERRIVDAHAHPQVKAALRDRRNRIVAEVARHGPHECVPAQAQLSLTRCTWRSQALEARTSSAASWRTPLTKMSSMTGPPAGADRLACEPRRGNAYPGTE